MYVCKPFVVDIVDNDVVTVSHHHDGLYIDELST